MQNSKKSPNKTSLPIEEMLLEFQRLFTFSEKNQNHCCGVTTTQCSVLLTCLKTDMLTMQALSSALRLDQSTMTRIIDTLVRKNLIERKNDEKDRRLTYVKLSTTGRKKAEELKICYKEFGKKIMKLIPAKQHQTVINSMEILTTVIEKLSIDTCYITKK